MRKVFIVGVSLILIVTGCSPATPIPTSTSTFSSLTDKTWVLTGGSWRELTSASFPSKRGSPAMGYDPVRKRIVIYGGFAASRNDFNDTLEWDGQQWICRVNCN